MSLVLRLTFSITAALSTTLGMALSENLLEERLKMLTQPKLLIVDEIGYIPIARHGASLLFQSVSRRYERKGYSSPASRMSARLARSLARSLASHVRSRSATAPRPTQ